MNRSDTTFDLSRRLEKWLSSRYHLWASEVYLKTYVPSGDQYDIRPDYLAFNPYRGNWMSKASMVERGEFTAFEIKSCKDDLFSGHGLNLIGDENVIVTTKELAEQMQGDGPVAAKVTSLMVDYVLVPSGSGLKVKYDLGWHRGYREFAASELLWAIVRTKRAHLARWCDATFPCGPDDLADVNYDGVPLSAARTCRNDEDALGKAVGNFECSVCGTTLYGAFDANNDAYIPHFHFCPNCGARLVTD